MNWKDNANDLMREISDMRDELDNDLYDLEQALITNDEALYIKVRDDYEER